ncbi:MAG TPA: DUF1735 domain-containing protein [Flavisolibacter sp.]|nr:DUF1735 domain-containing protein [Flavisolibacter sp.]
MKSIVNIKPLLLAGLMLPMLLLQSCLKDKNQLTNFSEQTTQPIVEIPEGGMGNFSASALNLTSDPDTIIFHVNLASTDFLNKDVTVTIGYDAAALASYNARGGLQYQKFPDSIYKLPTTKVTIKAGTRSVAIPIIMYPGKIDPTTNYMLPISITDASGTSISGNFGTIWYHLIGNPIAGSYTHEWQRWNNAVGPGSGTPAFDQFFGDVFSPVDPNTIAVYSGTGTLYLLHFDGTNINNLSNFQVSFDPQSVTDAGITITSGPTIITADPVNGIYKFTFGYNNSAGAARVIIDTFTK